MDAYENAHPMDDRLGTKRLQHKREELISSQFTIKTASFNDDGVTQPHSSQITAMPEFSQFQQQSCAVVLTGDPRVPSQCLAGSHDPSAQVPLNQEFSVDTELFSGRILALVKGLSAKDALAGTKWMGCTIFQGRFKRCIPAEDLWVGQELHTTPLLPASFQRLIFSAAAKFFSSTSRIKTEGEGNGFLNPLLAMAQTINISRPGCQPDMKLQVTEDMRLLSSALVGKKGRPLPSSQRQKYFDKPGNLAAAPPLDDNNIYTFVIGQSIMDLMQYKLSLGGFLNLDLCPLLNGQPLQMMCKNVRTGRTFFSVLVWHERLNYPEGCAARLGRSNCSRLSTTSSSSSTLAEGSSVDSSCCTSSSGSAEGEGYSSDSGCGDDNRHSWYSSDTGSNSSDTYDQEDCCSSVYGSACSHSCSSTSSLSASIDVADFIGNDFEEVKASDATSMTGTGRHARGAAAAAAGRSVGVSGVLHRDVTGRLVAKLKSLSFTPVTGGSISNGNRSGSSRKAGKARLRRLMQKCGNLRSLFNF